MYTCCTSSCLLVHTHSTDYLMHTHTHSHSHTHTLIETAPDDASALLYCHVTLCSVLSRCTLTVSQNNISTIKRLIDELFNIFIVNNFFQVPSILHSVVRVSPPSSLSFSLSFFLSLIE